MWFKKYTWSNLKGIIAIQKNKRHATYDHSGDFNMIYGVN